MLSDRRIVWVGVANALVLFLGLVGVGVVDTSGDDTSRVSSAGATTTTAGIAPGDPTATPAPGDPAAPGATTAPGGSPAATAAPGAAPPPTAAPSGVPATRPPSDGVYRNRIVTKGDDEEDTREVKARVTTVSRNDGEVKQRTETEGEDGGGDGGGGGFGGFSGNAESRWLRDAVYVRSDFGGDELDADCQPPEQLQMKLPLAKGVTWTNEIECTYTFDTPQGSATGRQKVRTTSTVTGTSTKSVAGKSFFVWEVFTDGTFEGTTTFGGKDYTNKGTTKTTTSFAPELGMAALIESDVSTEFMGQSGTAHSTVTLLNHTPE